MIRKRNKWHFGQILYLFSISWLKLFMYFDWFFPMNYRRTNAHNNILFFNHIKQIDSIEKDVFSSCRERETKKKFWFPMRNRTSDLRIPHGDWAFFLCPTLVTRRKKIFLYFFTELKTYHVSYFYLVIDSTLPRLCSVIYHRGCQYVARTSETHLAVSRMLFFFFFFSLPHFHFVCDLLLNRRTTEAQMYLFFSSKGRLFKQSLAFVYKTAFSAIFNSAEPIIWTFISRSCVTGVEG